MKDYYKDKRISNSSLSWFQTSPRYFKDMFDNTIEEESKPYFEKGQQVHMFILEPDEFEKEYTFMDYDPPKSAQQKAFCEKVARLKKGTKDEQLIRAYKDIYSTKESDDKILEKAKVLEKDYKDFIKFTKLNPHVIKVLPTAVLKQLEESKIKVLEHKVARNIVFSEEHKLFGDSDKLFIKNEFAIQWEYPKLGLSCKSMLDRIIIDHERKEISIVDLKTTSNLPEFKDKAKEYRYHRQMAFYWMAVTWYITNELKLNIADYTKNTYIVAISTKGPVAVKVFKVLESTLLDGLKEIEQVMPELKWHFDNNLWDYTRLYYEGEGLETF